MSFVWERAGRLNKWKGSLSEPPAAAATAAAKKGRQFDVSVWPGNLKRENDVIGRRNWFG